MAFALEKTQPESINTLPTLPIEQIEPINVSQLIPPHQKDIQ